MILSSNNQAPCSGQWSVLPCIAACSMQQAQNSMTTAGPLNGNNAVPKTNVVTHPYLGDNTLLLRFQIGKSSLHHSCSVSPGQS